MNITIKNVHLDKYDEKIFYHKQRMQTHFVIKKNSPEIVHSSNLFPFNSVPVTKPY